MSCGSASNQQSEDLGLLAGQILQLTNSVTSCSIILPHRCGITTETILKSGSLSEEELLEVIQTLNEEDKVG